MDAAVITAVIGLVTAVAAHWAGRRKTRAEADSMLAGAVETAMKTVQEAYAGVIATQTAQVTAANQRATAAEAAAREAKEQALLAADESWSAGQAARQMQRFLAEIRPLIHQYVPGAEPILARLDQLAPPARVGA